MGGIYTFRSMEDCISKLTNMFDDIKTDKSSEYSIGKIRAITHVNGTIERTLKVLAGLGQNKKEIGNGIEEKFGGQYD